MTQKLRDDALRNLRSQHVTEAAGGRAPELRGRFLPSGRKLPRLPNMPGGCFRASASVVEAVRGPTPSVEDSSELGARTSMNVRKTEMFHLAATTLAAKFRGTATELFM
mmetsp:Transcript_129382/g.414717  ORF Transcript_129382/g.414717 Transcript_129382/m.414717 type:complete len:109 (+) Transcript_129382:36-362(+)